MLNTVVHTLPPPGLQPKHYQCDVPGSSVAVVEWKRASICEKRKRASIRNWHRNGKSDRVEGLGFSGVFGVAAAPPNCCCIEVREGSGASVGACETRPTCSTTVDCGGQ